MSFSIWCKRLGFLINFGALHVLSSCGASISEPVFLSQDSDQALAQLESLANHLSSVSSKGKPSNTLAIRDQRYPSSPRLDVTPGSLCRVASELRYPEKVKYCRRNVDSSVKAKIFVDYDRKFGYETQKMERSQFKIDHLIPLCMGGSNEADNLWPQHQNIYNLTDPIEPLLCDAMSRGKIRQEVAVKMIRLVKENPVETEKYIRSISSGNQL